MITTFRRIPALAVSMVHSENIFLSNPKQNFEYSSTRTSERYIIPEIAYPSFGKLSLVRIQRYKYLIRQFVTVIAPKHVQIIGIGTHVIVSNPLGFVHLIQGVHQTFARYLNS